MAGAPALAALGAQRVGAGLVRIAVPRSIQSTVATLRPEATTAGLPETRSGSLALTAAATVERMAESWDAVVVGPGGGREASTCRFFQRAFAMARPLIVDADALFALIDQASLLLDRADPTVITPHEGEAGRLLGWSSSDVRRRREDAALALVEATGAVVVLKGPGTLVTDGERMFRCARGGPWLATGGTGDVLAGVCGALVAGLPDTGGDPFGAACAAVHVHALAADQATKTRDRGLIASDLAATLPAATATLVGPRRKHNRGSS